MEAVLTFEIVILLERLRERLPETTDRDNVFFMPTSQCEAPCIDKFEGNKTSTLPSSCQENRQRLRNTDTHGVFNECQPIT